jgi:peptidoglycan/LPS O-acetylase OafA/YrhL
MAFGVVAVVIVCLHVDAPDLLIVGLFAALILTAVLKKGSFSEIANAGPLIWLGDISYSLYLIHGFVQFLANKLLSRFGMQNHADLSIHQSLVLMVLMIGVCLLAAHLTYYGIEIGCRQYVRGLFGIPAKVRTAPVLLRSPQPVTARQRVS